MIQFANEYIANFVRDHVELYKVRCTNDPNYHIKTFYSIFSEIKLISKHYLSSLYIIPSSYCPLVWNGILMVSKGFYQGCNYKLTIIISLDYPNQKGQPVRIFLSPSLYHPQVHLINGEFELGRVFQHWIKDENKLIAVLTYIEKALCNLQNCDAIDISLPANTEAAILCTKNPKIFEEKVLEYNNVNWDENKHLIYNNKTHDAELYDQYNMQDIHDINLVYQDINNELPCLDFDAIIGKMKTFNQDFDTMMTEDFEEKERSYSWFKPSCPDKT